MSMCPDCKEAAARVVQKRIDALTDDPRNGYVESDTNSYIWTDHDAGELVEELDEVVLAIHDLPTKEPDTHTDHPLRHFDRTCPACIAESATQHSPNRKRECQELAPDNAALADTQQNAAPGNAKVICHAPGDKCLGCAHYYGKADRCEYAPAPDAAPGMPEWTAPRITQLRERAESAERECKWFRDACSILGFDAPGGDGCNPLKERLNELLAVERRLREMETEIIALNGIIKVRAGGANAADK